MNIMFLLFAALLIPSFESDDDDAAATPETPPQTPPETPSGTDTASAIAADPTAPALNAATDAGGNTLVQGNGAATDITGTSIMDFIMAEPSLAAEPIGNIDIHGGDGDDTINVADLDVRSVSGGLGDDAISSFTFQGFGPDVVNGNAGDDTIEATGADVFGGAGDDSIEGGGNPEAGVSVEIDGGAGDDTITSGELARVRGGLGEDSLTGFANNTLEGNEGNDTLVLRGIGATADGGAGDDDISFNYNAFSGSIINGGGGADIATGVALTGGEGADDFIITGAFDEVPLSAAGSSLFATVTDFDFAEDTLVIELDTTPDPAVSGGGYEFNKNISLISTVSGPEIGFFEINFSLSGENAAGMVETRTLTIRLQEENTDLEFDFLDIVETASGVAVSLVPAAAAPAA